MPTLESLQQQLDQLKRQNEAISGSLARLLVNAGLPVPPAMKTPSAPNVLPNVQEEEKAESVPSPVFVEEVVESKKKEDEGNLEERIGVKLFSRLGIIALVVGIGFFIKYVNDNNLISHLGRVIIGVAAGAGLILAGEVSSRFKKYSSWGKVLTGGGLAVVYFVVYAAYAFKDYRSALGMTQGLDIALLVLTALLAIFFSIRDNSQVIAGEAFFLGFLTCLLNRDFGNMVLVYDFILTVALVFTVAYKKWPIIGIGGVVCSYLVYSLWRADNPESNLLAISFLSLFFLSYVLQSTIFSSKLAGDKIMEAKVVSANILNSLFFFVCGILVAREWAGDYDALFCLLFGAFHLFACWAAWYFGKRVTSYVYFYFGIAALSIAVPLWFNKEAITIVWSVLSLVVLLAGLKARYRPLELSAYALGFLTFWKVIFFDTDLAAFSLNDILGSTRFLAFSAAAIFFLIGYFALAASRDSIFKPFRGFIPYAYAIAPTFLLMVMLGIEAGVSDNLNWLTMWWGLLFLAVAMMPLAKDFKEFRWQGVAIGSLVVFKVFAYDLLSVNLDGDKLDSYHLLTYSVAIALFLGASFVWRFKKDLLAGDEGRLPSIYQWLGVILVFLAIVLELDGYWVSIGWAVLALALIVCGFIFKDKDSRYQGIGILLFTLLKVFLYDTSELETGYRMISYISLGGILLGSSFLYNKYKDKM